MADKKPRKPRRSEPGLPDVQAFAAAAAGKSDPVFIGIDPGANGGIALLCGKLWCVVSIPVRKVARQRRVKVKDAEPGGKKTRVVHGKTAKFDLIPICLLFKALKDLRHRITAGVEIATPRVRAVRASDIRTAYMTGCGFYMWPLFLHAKGYDVKEIEPESWKKQLGLINTTKEDARRMARKIWPDAPLARKKDDGRADALLIAHCLRLRHDKKA